MIAPNDGSLTRTWASKELGQRWTVYTGSYLDAQKLPSPEVIYFDMYSPRTCPELWSTEAFKQLRALCRETTLYTYSSSTRVRVALLLAGFFVGYGRSTGAKYDTTTAATSLAELERPLDTRWIERLKRSHAFAPYGDEHASQNEILEKILTLGQFSKNM